MYVVFFWVIWIKYCNFLSLVVCFRDYKKFGLNGDIELGVDVEMIVVKGKMLGQISFKVVFSEFKIYDLIKIILNFVFKEGVYNLQGEQLRNLVDSFGCGG